MKIKITDVKPFVKEIVVERLKDYSFSRNDYKLPTVEDQARIQKEFGMKIDFSYCIQNANYMNINWHMPIEGKQFPFNYGTYISIEEVNSTMDEDYAILIVSLLFSKPQHIAIAYGPKELMKSDQFMIKSKMDIRNDSKKDI